MIPQTINEPVRTLLASSTNPSVFDQAVSFAANVVLRDSPPSDFAILTMDEDGFATGTTARGGVVSITTAPESVNQVVSKANSRMTLSSSASPTHPGQSVIFTATVGTTMVPGSSILTGAVTFKDGNTVLSTVTLRGGIATYSTSRLDVGTHTIKAEYSGDNNFLSSITSIRHMVDSR